MSIASSITHPHGPASALGSSTHWFAIGLLVGVAVAATPLYVKIPVIIFDVVALGWSFLILHYADTARGPWVLTGTALLLAGMAVGVVRGLRHLGDAEFIARRRNIRALGRWF